MASVQPDESSWLVALAQSFGEMVFEGSAGDFAPAEREAVPCGECPAGRGGGGEGFAGEVGGGLLIGELDGLARGFGCERHGQCVGGFDMASSEGCQRQSGAEHAHAGQARGVGREGGNEANLITIDDDFALRKRADELGQVGRGRCFSTCDAGGAPFGAGCAAEFLSPGFGARGGTLEFGAAFSC